MGVAASNIAKQVRGGRTAMQEYVKGIGEEDGLARLLKSVLNRIPEKGEGFGAKALKVGLGPLSGIELADDTAKYMFRMGSLYEDAYAIAGRAAKGESQKVFKYAVQHPTEAMLQKADKVALELTFQDKSRFQKLMDTARNFEPIERNSKYMLAHPQARYWLSGIRPGRIIVPFFNINYRIAVRGFEAVPVIGLTSTIPKVFGKFGANSKAARASALGKSILSTVTGTYFAYKAMNGELTGEAPRGAEGDTSWARKPANSIKIGDEWVTYDGLGVISVALGSVANFAQALRDPNVDEHGVLMTAYKAAEGFLSAVTAAPSLRGIAELAIAAREGDTQKMDYIRRTVVPLFPMSSMSRNVASAIDPQMRERSGLVDEYQAITPWVSKSLPPKRRALTGEPIPRPGANAFERFASPVRTRSATPEDTGSSRVYKEAERLGIGFQRPTKDIEIMKLKGRLNPAQWDRLQEISGQLAIQEIMKTIHSGGYLRASRQEQIQEFQNARGRALSKVRGWMKKSILQNPEAASEVFKRKVGLLE
jgi:hypothetical protein